MSGTIEPVDFDRDTGPFFHAAREGRLIYRFCRACQRGFHVPAQYCNHCGSPDTEWRDASGDGVLYSWTTVPKEVHPAYPAPYTIVVVSLAEAPDVRLVGSIAGEPRLSAGQPMTVWFQEVADGVVLPQWRTKE